MKRDGALGPFGGGLAAPLHEAFHQARLHEPGAEALEALDEEEHDRPVARQEHLARAVEDPDQEDGLDDEVVRRVLEEGDSGLGEALPGGPQLADEIDGRDDHRPASVLGDAEAVGEPGMAPLGGPPARLEPADEEREPPVGQVLGPLEELHALLEEIHRRVEAHPGQVTEEERPRGGFQPGEHQGLNGPRQDERPVGGVGEVGGEPLLVDFQKSQEDGEVGGVDTELPSRPP